MGIFGKNKKEQIAELQLEVEKLSTELDTLQKDNADLKNSYNELSASIPKEKKDFDELQDKSETLKATISALEDRIENKENFIAKLDKDIAKLTEKFHQRTERIRELQKTIDNYFEEICMQEYGIYRPTFEFANSDLYKDKLQELRNSQKSLIKNGSACTGDHSWSVNGSLSQGRHMVGDMQKLLLRAFNVECDDIINNVKISNIDKSRDRINKSAEQISKLGKMMSISISPAYIHYKIKELELALDFAVKKADEKERLRELRAQQREEAKAQKEIEEARKKLEKEQAHYQNALKALLSQLEKDPENADLIAKKAELESNIEDTQKAISDVDYREANKRAGYVYIISNIGAFGENVYKIGMTRRLEPMDRVNELGDASVPFNFDVHALIFTEDAPGLENALHVAFESKKVNKVNPRREFFHVTLNEIKEVVRKNFDKTVEWVDVAEAEQYRQSLVMQ
jgi:tetratricopeptide (TPR) repeat protein